jgi:hypothetical protein
MQTIARGSISSISTKFDDRLRAFWLTETRKNFPRATSISPADAPPPHGSDFAEQCKVPRRSAAGCITARRATTRRISPDALGRIRRRAVRAYYSFEPAGNVDATGVARVYNATASGRRACTTITATFSTRPPPRKISARRGLAPPRKPIVEIAAFYPSTSSSCTGRISSIS